MRECGATDKGFAKALTQYRNKVIIAPSGSYGLITELVLQPAGSFKVSDNDPNTFQFDIISDDKLTEYTLWLQYSRSSQNLKFFCRNPLGPLY